MKLALAVAPVASAPAAVPAADAKVVGIEVLERHSSTSRTPVDGLIL